MPGINLPQYVKPPMGMNANAKASPTQSAYNNYGTAMRQQGEDYSDIMNKFRSVYDSAGSGNGSGSANFNFDVNLPTYQTTPDYRSAVNNLADLSKTGGYSQADIDNIRERGISPIRSVYGNAQNNLKRQRTLQGGYSPNFAAVSAKMAREMSSQLSDATTNVNAQIAQQVAQNKIGIAGQYAGTTAGEQGSRNNFELERSKMANQFGLDKLNMQERQFEIPFQTRLSALSGMANLYGTTPAIGALTQNGAQNQASLQANIQSNNRSHGLNTLGRYLGA